MSGEPVPPRCDCLCVGIVVADFICAPVERVPPAGGLVMTDGISLAIGGCASNVAVDLCKLQRQVAVVGRVGADLPGQFVRSELAAAGADTIHLKETPGFQTSSTLVINVRGEDRRFIHTFGANAAFDGTEIGPDLLAGARTLYVGGFLLMPRFSAECAARLFQAARAARIPTLLDVVVPDPGTAWERLRAVLPWTDVFMPNVDEGRQISGLAAPLDQARFFRDAGATTVVITCGGAGAVLVGPGLEIRAAGFPAEFVDGTGSGDAFAAGYISGLLDGAGPERCLELGAALGASCVRRAGATTGVFTRREFDEFLAHNRLEISRL